MAFLTSLAMSAVAVPAVAQTSPPRPTDVSRAEFDVRVGDLWPQVETLDRPTLGGRVILYLWPDRAQGKLSLHVVGDYRATSRVESFDEEFLTRSLTEKHIIAGGPSLAVDLIRRPYFVIDARAGGLLVRERTNFSINSADGFVQDNDEYENVCPYQGFDVRCGSDWDVTATLSVGLRAYIGSDGPVFIGVDYTRLVRGQNLLAGSIGVRLE